MVPQKVHTQIHERWGGDRTLAQDSRGDSKGTVRDLPFPGLLQRGKLIVSRWPSLRA